MAEERLSSDGKTKLLNLIEAGDPKGEVATAWAMPRKQFVSSMAIKIKPLLIAGLMN
jgi:hypothetical protein